MVWAFDFLLYPYVIYQFGLAWGFPVLLILSFLLCYGTLVFYDWSKQDWLGIEAIKEVKEYEGNSRFRKIAAWALRRSDPVAILFLSLKFDPFITVIYMRKGSRKFNGLSRRDWRIFLASLVIGNAYWSLAAYMGVTLFEWGWEFVGPASQLWAAVARQG